jgi:hypothetical protein
MMDCQYWKQPNESLDYFTQKMYCSLLEGEKKNKIFHDKI